jgi:fluoroquinolone transport system permease protein
MHYLKAMLKADFKNITRDEVLLYMPLVPLLLGFLLRFGMPPLREALLEHIDLAVYYPFITAFFLLISPMFIGWVFGFLLLDEKDQHVLAVIRSTPLGSRRFLLYRLGTCTVLGMLLSLVLTGIAGLAPFHAAWGLPLLFMAALEGPLLALFLGSFADNKVQGLALGKLAGFFFMGPFVTLFVASNWHLLGGLSPSYWVTQAYLSGLEGSPMYAFYLGAGMVIHLGLLWLLLRCFAKRA